MGDPSNPWQGKCGTGVGEDAFTSGFEGPWTLNPNKWDNEFFKVLISERWEKYIGPGGHWQWKTADPNSRYASTMRLTSDLALLEDPSFAAISHEFAEDQGKLGGVRRGLEQIDERRRVVFSLEVHN